MDSPSCFPFQDQITLSWEGISAEGTTVPLYYSPQKSDVVLAYSKWGREDISSKVHVAVDETIQGQGGKLIINRLGESFGEIIKYGEATFELKSINDQRIWDAGVNVSYVYQNPPTVGVTAVDIFRMRLLYGLHDRGQSILRKTVYMRFQNEQCVELAQ